LTSTSPNGVVVTVIATTYVPGDAGGAAAPTSTRTPSLQNAAVSRHSGGSVLAGVVALAMLFIVV
jgi:C4-dicarboxylate transporter